MMHMYTLLTGVFYYQLGNLSPKYRSSLSSIHLVSIAKSSVIKTPGSESRGQGGSTLQQPLDECT